MSAEESALLRSVVALVRQRYGLDEIEATIYIVEMPNRIKALEAENTALRARALPVIEWRGKSAVSGGFLLEVREQFGWELEISHNGTIVLRGGTPGGTEDQIKAICEAAFLRLVGCGNG